MKKTAKKNQKCASVCKQDRIYKKCGKTCSKCPFDKKDKTKLSKGEAILSCFYAQDN